MKKNIAAGLIVLLVIAGVLFISTSSLRAQNVSNDSDISRKLDEILSNQKAMRDDMNLIRQEIAVIKIRVTQIQ